MHAYAAAATATSLDKIRSTAVYDFTKVSLIKTKFYHFDYVITLVYMKVTNGYGEITDEEREDACKCSTNVCTC